MKNDYIFCSDRPWALNAFARNRSRLAGHWSVCVSPEDLENTVHQLDPRYIFFPHWSNIVPEAILNAHECVCFHMTDVPFGRGGSPLQNLISRGYKETVLTALKMTNILDAGPVYMKNTLDLTGSASQILERASEVSISMIDKIIRNNPKPIAQSGQTTKFSRRRPAQSAVPVDADPQTLYDHIRMLDAEGYPNAFIHHGSWAAKFTEAHLDGNSVEARVRFEKIEREK